jgi:RHH-type proline utilization regulon transcriptional repressor/proline dehydrogenase/delta 1-pyrroline-5-carboxylate dehydrogenase
MAYLVRRLLENTSNESFIRQRFAEGQTLDALVAPPAAVPLPEPVEAVERAATDPEHPGPFANEPHAELRRPAVRDRLVTAVGAARLGFDAPLLIDGQPVATVGQIVSVDPGDVATGVCRSARARPDDAVRAIEIAAQAWPAWRATPWRERAAVLFRAAAIMRRRRAELAALEVFEAGKPIPEADADVCEAIDFCEYYGREALCLARAGGVTVRRDQRLSLPAAGGRRRDRAVELPARDPGRHGDGRTRHRELRRLQAGGADTRHRTPPH